MKVAKRNLFLSSILGAALGLSGCSQIKLLTSSQEIEEKKADSSVPAAEAESALASDQSEDKSPRPADPGEVLPIAEGAVQATEPEGPIPEYCQKIEKRFQKYAWNWKGNSCARLPWIHVRTSVLGDPLMWLVYGNEAEHRKTPKDATMILCGVHGDEITPIKFCFDVIAHLEKFKEDYQDKLIVVAPIVNPDSFFKAKPTRTNQRNIDVNRNFPTDDWYAKAIKMWQSRYRSDKRRYPGKRPLSEPETLFQVNLIKRYNPSKIISVHAPFTLLDYDGPGDQEEQKGEVGARANQLLIQMSQKAQGYRVKNYPFFPGSLGNWAGNERQIPTYTLELPSSDYTQTDKYWILFRDAIESAILHNILPNSEVAMGKKDVPAGPEQSKN